MRKSAFWICKNKGADNRTADQRLCFCYIDSSVPLSFKPLIIFYGCKDWFVSDLVGNNGDRFSRDMANWISGKCFSK